MKKLSILLSLSFLVCFSCMAQEITIKNGFFGYRFIQNGQKYKFQETARIVKPNAEAYALLKEGYNLNTISTLPSLIGAT